VRPDDGRIPAEIVSAAQAGDPDALRALFDRVQPLVACIIGALVGNAPDARDLCADACAEVLLNVGRFRGDGRFSAWVYAVTVRRIGRWYERRRLQRMLQQQRPLLEPNPSSPPPDEILVREEARRFVSREILRLPRRMYLAITLVDLAGMSPAEAAAMIGGTARSISNASYRAKVRIQERLVAAGLMEPELLTVAPILGGGGDASAVRSSVPEEPAAARGVEHDARD